MATGQEPRQRDQLERGKTTAAEQAQQMAGAVEGAAERLDEQGSPLAGYVHELSSSMARFSDDLRHRSVDQLVSDAQSLARRNPTLFLMGSVAIGLTLSRFLKASGERASARGWEEASRSEYGPDYAASGVEPPTATPSRPDTGTGTYVSGTEPRTEV